MASLRIALVFVCVSGVSRAADTTPPPPSQLVRAKAGEPVAEELSLARAAHSMDEAAVQWQNTNECCQCHANLFHLIARPALAGIASPTSEVRAFFERLVSHRWEREGLRYPQIKVPAGDPRVGTEAVVVAVPLAINDVRTTGRLHPLTRRALDRMISLQRANGSWNVVTDLPADGFNDYTQAMLAAIGITTAPDDYRETESAKKAIEGIHRFAQATSPASHFHQGWLLWAASKLPQLISDQQRAACLEDLMKLQRDDGGWCYAELLLDDEKRHVGTHAAQRPSDGYGTGFVVFVARQAGVAADDPRLQRGIAWLKANQRESGRWFNETLVNRRFNIISNSTTCWAVLALEACGEIPAAPAPQPPAGDAVIRGRAGPSEIVITTTSRLAGAIHSLTWNDREFINSTDHGRQLQSAANFDTGRPILAETFNPTEAGSRADHVGPKSSSRLWRIHAAGNELETQNQMAFWLAPGEKSLGNDARNDRVLSDHLLSKRVRIGYQDLPHAVQYDVTFTVPPGEGHKHAVFEALTGYMPAEFENFWRFKTATGTLEPLDDGPGEQAAPVVFSVAEGTHAMGVYSPDQPSAGFESLGYGRFRFGPERVVKWNCVFRVTDPAGIKAGEFAYRLFVAVGTLDDVKATLAALAGKPK